MRNKIRFRRTIAVIFSLFAEMQCLDNLKTKSNHEQGDNIVFDIPDLTILYSRADTAYLLEAFNVRGNDWILKQNNPWLLSRLRWISLGWPSIVKRIGDNGNSSIFEFNRDGFDINLQMLSPGQMLALAAHASKKYKINASSPQILQLVPARMACSISFLTYKAYPKAYVIKGQVLDFRTYPLKLQFWAAEGIPEREAFESRLSDIMV